MIVIKFFFSYLLVTFYYIFLNDNFWRIFRVFFFLSWFRIPVPAVPGPSLQLRADGWSVSGCCLSYTFLPIRPFHSADTLRKLLSGFRY